MQMEVLFNANKSASDVSSRKKEEPAPNVSFARDIRPLFRACRYLHMQPHGVKLDDYTFMSKPDNANRILRTLSRAITIRLPCRPRALLDTRSARVCSPSGKKTATTVSVVMRMMLVECGVDEDDIELMNLPVIDLQTSTNTRENYGDFNNRNPSAAATVHARSAIQKVDWRKTVGTRVSAEGRACLHR